MTEDPLVADVRRSILLGAYIRCWGQPDERVVSRRGDDAVELYSFPFVQTKVHRFATAGVSGLRCEDARLASWELLLTLPRDLGGATSQEVVSLALDVMAYSLRRDVPFKIGLTIPETPLMPKAWSPRALLVDEPRGEPEELTSLRIGSQHVKLVWLVPIHGDERQLIVDEGLDSFDQLAQDSDWSLADPGRPSLLNR
jgi:hypothetical protein